MIIEPKTRGFICTTAHPAGCDENVHRMIDHVTQNRTDCPAMPKKVLVIGSSMGYGLATRIAAAFGGDAATVGVAFEKPAQGTRCASAGWYNTAAFDKYASERGLYSANVMGDAYSLAVKDAVCEIIKKDLGKIDMLVYSLAAPRRTMADGSVVSSVLKPVGEHYSGTGVDLRTHTLTTIGLEPASEAEIEATVRVMGGDDWRMWIERLADEGLLAENFTTVAYSYVGPALTHAIYKDGTIGQAKKHLAATAKELAEHFGIRALISVNKALVTQSSAAIPVVPLYISVLFAEMKKRGTHEGVIEQMDRMMKKLYSSPLVTDSDGMLRMDDWEMEHELQAEIADIWQKLSDENVSDFADFAEYDREFLRLFGFMVDGVDYSADVSADALIEHLTEVTV